MVSVWMKGNFGSIGRQLIASSTYLSAQSRVRIEHWMLVIAIAGYLIHLLLIALVHYGFLPWQSELLKSPIAAIYTPFSFILLYEVYLLIFFLPKSITTYIGKQYEIMALIVVRRLFKDLAKLELTANWFESANDLQFTYDVISSLLLFGLIYLFYRKNAFRTSDASEMPTMHAGRMHRFIRLKTKIALLLVPVLVGLACVSLYQWTNTLGVDYQRGIAVISNVNQVFFGDFFTVLIVVDVLLLLASLFYSDEFHIIMRNSGFIISTILLKMSFSVEGLVNNVLIVSAVCFGYLMLVLHDLYLKNPPPKAV
ncbi:MAG: hypothetical protein ACK417_09360 [Bacteroidia bacterium]